MEDGKEEGEVEEKDEQEVEKVASLQELDDGNASALSEKITICCMLMNII